MQMNWSFNYFSLPVRFASLSYWFVLIIPSFLAITIEYSFIFFDKINLVYAQESQSCERETFSLVECPEKSSNENEPNNENGEGNIEEEIPSVIPFPQLDNYFQLVTFSARSISGVLTSNSSIFYTFVITRIPFRLVLSISRAKSILNCNENHFTKNNLWIDNLFRLIRNCDMGLTDSYKSHAPNINTQRLKLSQSPGHSGFEKISMEQNLVVQTNSTVLVMS